MTDFEKYIKGKNIPSYNLHKYQNVLNSTVQMPTVLEERELNAVAVNIFSRLLLDRIIFLGTDVNEESANIITAQLMYLNSEDNKKPIQMFINSPGGSVSDGLQIYDTMQMIKAPVYTICTGSACSMAAVLLAGGEKGYRGALPNSEIMIHQPSGGALGQATDIEIANAHIQRCKNKLYKLLATDTGKTIEEIKADSDRDYWMTAEEALQYGLIDKIFDKKGML